MTDTDLPPSNRLSAETRPSARSGVPYERRGPGRPWTAPATPRTTDRSTAAPLRTDTRPAAPDRTARTEPDPSGTRPASHRPTRSADPAPTGDRAAAPEPVDDPASDVTTNGADRADVGAPTARTGTSRRPTTTVIVHGSSMRRLDELTECLDAVVEQLPPPDEVICVIDPSSFMRKALDRWAGFDRLRRRIDVVENAGTPGRAGATNTGLAKAAGDVVVLVEEDALPRDGWLRSLLGPFTDDEVSAVTGRVEARWLDPRPDWFSPHLDWMIGCSVPNVDAAGGPIGSVHATSIAFRRSALRAVGGYPTGFDDLPSGCAPAEMCIRVGRLAPTGAVRHTKVAGVVRAVTDEHLTVGHVLRRCRSEGHSRAELARRVGATTSADVGSYTRAIARSIAGDLLTVRRRPRRLGRAAVLTAAAASMAAGYVEGRLRPSVGTR